MMVECSLEKVDGAKIVDGQNLPKIHLNFHVLFFLFRRTEYGLAHISRPFFTCTAFTGKVPYFEVQRFSFHRMVFRGTLQEGQKTFQQYLNYLLGYLPHTSILITIILNAIVETLELGY